MEIKFIPLEEKDLNKIVEVEKQLFDHPLTKQDYLQYLEKTQQAYFIKCVVNQQLIGWAGVLFGFEEAQLMIIGVLEPYRKQGYGKKLLEQCIFFSKSQNVEHMILEVATNNIAAYNLYQQAGFEINRIRKNYYPNQDAYEMIKKLR